jgi:hypothetical protein
MKAVEIVLRRTADSDQQHCLGNNDEFATSKRQRMNVAHHLE